MDELVNVISRKKEERPDEDAEGGTVEKDI